MSEQTSPEVRVIDRRRFLTLSATAAAGLTAAAGAVVLARRRPDSPPTPEDVPIRNPAFRTAKAETPENLVLYCYQSSSEPVAYELNGTGRTIWESCGQGEGSGSEGRPSIREIVARLSGHVESATVLDFIGELQSRGLVYFLDPAAQVYFAFEGAH